MWFSHWDAATLSSVPMDVRWGFSGVFQSHSYPLHHLDAPIRGDPCHHYMYSNDTDTWLRQRHFRLVRI